MSRHYTASTRDRIGDLVTGMRIDTSEIACDTYFDEGQHEIFNVFGRIMIMELYFEVTAVHAANACTLLFNYTSSDPVITVKPFTTVSVDDFTSSDVGDRMSFIGGILTGVPKLSATECIGDEYCTDPIMIGLESGTGTIGIDTVVAATQGNGIFSIHYVPMSDGAYVTAAA